MAPPTKETLDRLCKSDGGYDTRAALQALLDGGGNEQRALEILRGGSSSGGGGGGGAVAAETGFAPGKSAEQQQRAVGILQRGVRRKQAGQRTSPRFEDSRSRSASPTALVPGGGGGGVEPLARAKVLGDDLAGATTVEFAQEGMCRFDGWAAKEMGVS